MHLPTVFRILCRSLFYVSLFLFDSSASAQHAEKLILEKVEFERLAKIFAPAGLPNIKDKPWVSVDTGPANEATNLSGWLIKETPEKIELLLWNGAVLNLRRASANERRPAVMQDKGQRLLWTESVAWQVRTEDYQALSKKFLEDGIPHKEDKRDIYSEVNHRFALADRVVDAARYAYFTRHLGKENLALELYSHAVKVQKDYLRTYISHDRLLTLHEFVADRIASRLSNGAISSGHYGTSRKELLQEWEKVAVIPYQKYRDEGKALVKHYQNLLDEDARWIEPNADEFAKLTTDQKVTYWLYHLRDLDIEQNFDPGRCDVLHNTRIDYDGKQRKKHHPAVELKNIGIAAIPLLIAHMDDARPTRCKGHWRSYWPEGNYLLRYGDCCQQIFEAITGHKIFRGTTTVSYPIHDGEGAKCKERAEQWWQDYQKKSKP